jgi:hypothetical protein
MYKFIIISSCLFGSIYLFSISLKQINNSYIVYRKEPLILNVVNGLIFGIYGSIFLYISIDAIKYIK